MSVNDPISDMLTRIRNAGMARKAETVMPSTKILVAINVVVYLITVAQGAGIFDPGGTLYTKWLLFGPAVSHGDWWRLITSAFLHANLIHIALNMLALWWLGSPVELALGRLRYLGLYLVSGLAGSAGALIANPHTPTVGASGAVNPLVPGRRATAKSQGRVSIRSVRYERNAADASSM